MRRLPVQANESGEESVAGRHEPSGRCERLSADHSSTCALLSAYLLTGESAEKIIIGSTHTQSMKLRLHKAHLSSELSTHYYLSALLLLFLLLYMQKVLIKSHSILHYLELSRAQQQVTDSRTKCSRCKIITSFAFK